MNPNDYWCVYAARGDENQMQSRRHSTYAQASRDAVDFLEAGYWVRLDRVVAE